MNEEIKKLEEQIKTKETEITKLKLQLLKSKLKQQFEEQSEIKDVTLGDYQIMEEIIQVWNDGLKK